ncbi:MAG: glycoside hydrolase family 88 protein [Bacteroidales bacterium]|nr:glycoside hydrolase family 88 protein [Bacteroidales bacterium]
MRKRLIWAAVCAGLICIGAFAVYAINSDNGAGNEKAVAAGRATVKAETNARATGKIAKAAAKTPYSDAEEFIDEALDYCAEQAGRTVRELEAEAPDDYSLTPRNIAPGDTTWTLDKVTKEEWTAGFWPGILWYNYEYTGDPKMAAIADNYTRALDFITRTPAYDHDVGFLIFCSYGNGYRLTGNDDYRQAILRTADALAKLYNPKVGTILSWPREVENLGGHNTIMDNMINLETLFWAAANGGDRSLYDIACSHADKTMRNNFRPDGSSYHVAVYNSETGEFIKGMTHQGYADDSMWARGQGWGIYGFTMCYRYTHDRKYLDFAQKITDLYLSRLPEDYVPYWDFDDPAIPDAPKDASAAAVVASGLIELAEYVDAVKGQTYREAAEKILRSLDENYRGGEACPAILLHSTGHKPAGKEIDNAIIYADYYYYEALLRMRRVENGRSAVL